jgi:Type VI secretion system/phage-baseplate injector OB domain
MAGLNKEDLMGKIFIGEIVDNNDPEQEGRCKIKVFGLFDGDDIAPESIPWAQPFGRKMFAGGENGGYADISVPKLGTYVRVQFAEGDLMAAEYTAIQSVSPEVKAEIGDTYINSHVLAYDVDEEMKIFYTPGKGLNIFHKNSQIIINPDSSITIEHADTDSIIELIGPQINIVARERVTVTAPNVTIDHTDSIELGAGAVEKLVLGDSFLTLFNTHTHLGNLGAPTSPPVVPMQPQIHLSGRGASPVVKTL